MVETGKRLTFLRLRIRTSNDANDGKFSTSIDRREKFESDVTCVSGGEPCSVQKVLLGKRRICIADGSDWCRTHEQWHNEWRGNWHRKREIGIDQLQTNFPFFYVLLRVVLDLDARQRNLYEFRSDFRFGPHVFGRATTLRHFVISLGAKNDV